MKLILIFLILCPICTSLAIGGEIFGNIKENNNTAVKGKKVETHIGKQTYSAVTDSFGAYRLFVPEKGKCTFRLYYDKDTLSFDIFSYNKSTRCDFLVETEKGRNTLRRR